MWRNRVYGLHLLWAAILMLYPAWPAPRDLQNVDWPSNAFNTGVDFDLYQQPRQANGVHFRYGRYKSWHAKALGDRLALSDIEYLVALGAPSPWAAIAPHCYVISSAVGNELSAFRKRHTLSQAYEHYGQPLASEPAVAIRVSFLDRWKLTGKRSHNWLLNYIYCSLAELIATYCHRDYGRDVEACDGIVYQAPDAKERFPNSVNLADRATGCRPDAIGKRTLTVRRNDHLSGIAQHNNGGSIKPVGQNQGKRNQDPRYLRIRSTGMTSGWLDREANAAVFDIQGEDIDASYDGAIWFHVYGPNCIAHLQLDRHQ